MNKFWKYLGIIFLVSNLSACETGITTADLSEQVKASIVDSWSKDPQLSSINVHDLTLIHKGDKEYRGILEVKEGDQITNLTVNVIYDGESFIWEVTQ